ncbi:MAG TPA: DUF2804 domain-containing protein [Spirochaetota bacterium]|nr:DUF2804 domain-containing protein [Spirochaetota bacterium]
MRKLIDNTGKVIYGSFDEPMRFNHEDFKLRNFFGKEIRGIRKRIAFNTFNFISINTDDFIVGLAAVNLGYINNLFGYVHRFESGEFFETNRILLPSKISFPGDPDNYDATFNGRNIYFHIHKSHKEGALDLECSFEGKLSVTGRFAFSLKNKPLRVANPSCGDPYRYTFTEKCPLFAPEDMSVIFKGEELVHNIPDVTGTYDWSGGYLNRNTNWLWSAFAGTDTKGHRVGANFAALTNESYYSENAIWIGSKRTRIPRVIYDIDIDDPTGSDWRIFSEDGKIDLTFRPLGRRGQKLNAFFVKLDFRQMFGNFSGKITGDDGKSVTLKNVRGVSEMHLSHW